MLIRSQNKEVLVAFENLLDIEISSGGVISARVDNGWSCLLGEYSTTAKAMKVLDMIQEAYADEKLVDYTTCLQRKDIEKMDDSTILALRNELMKKAVFQIPDDSEVEE